MTGWIVLNAPPGSPAATSNARQVAIAAVDPAGKVVYAEVAEELPGFASEGGWQFVARPRTTGFTEYQGINPYTLTVPLIFDGWRRGQSVDQEVETLRLMMRTRVGPRQEPPVVRITGACVPLTWLSWVIQNIEWKDSLRDANGSLLRCFVTVTFMQYLGADLVVGPAAAAQARAPANAAVSASPTASSNPAPSNRTYTVKRGDTLYGIAAAQLGDANRWHDVANLNNIRDPKSLQAGQVLRLP